MRSLTSSGQASSHVGLLRADCKFLRVATFKFKLTPWRDKATRSNSYTGVGPADGTNDRVGTKETEGATEGDGEGAALGGADGFADGDADGSLDGCEVGDTVGAAVG